MIICSFNPSYRPMRLPDGLAIWFNFKMSKNI